VTTDSGAPGVPARARVILLTGPSGCGKSHLAVGSGLPILHLDDFYKAGDDPTLPRHPDLGIIDWDDPAAWDEAAAFAAIERLCHDGSADVPEYEKATDSITGQHRLELGGASRFIAEGLFAARLVDRCREAGLLADAIVVARRPWKNYVRRLTRDLVEGRKPPSTVLRRGRLLMAAEEQLVAAQVALGCRPLSARHTAAALQGRGHG